MPCSRGRIQLANGDVGPSRPRGRDRSPGIRHRARGSCLELISSIPAVRLRLEDINPEQEIRELWILLSWNVPGMVDFSAISVSQWNRKQVMVM